MIDSVCIAMRKIPYEGSYILGVFGSREEAQAYIDGVVAKRKEWDIYGARDFEQELVINKWKIGEHIE